MEAVERRAADRIGQDVWKWVSGILAAILLTGLASWFAFGRETLSRTEAERMQTEWAGQNAELRALVAEQSRQVNLLTVEMAKTNERLQALIERMDREGR